MIGSGSETRRVAVYCRVSKVEMTNGEFDSLDGQEARCRHIAEAYGWTVVDVLADASTGSNTDRPSLQAHNVALVSVTESFDSTTPQGRLMMNILAGFAEFEREQIIARSKQGLAARAEAGGWPIRHTPFGYDRVSSGEGSPKTLEPNGNGKWVREAFRRYLDGDSPGVVADWLAEQGVLNTRGRRWNGRCVGRMLRHVAYAGRVPWNGEAYEGKHPAIVGDDLWRAVQERLATGQRGQFKEPRDQARGDYTPALVGRIVDASGESFKRTWATGRGGRHIYYYIAPDTGTRYNAEAFDAEVMRMVREAMSNPQIFARALLEAQDGQRKRLAAVAERLGELAGTIAELGRREARLIEAVADGLDATKVKPKLEAIGGDRERLQREVERRELEREAVEREQGDLDTFGDLRDFFEAVGEGSGYIDTGALLDAMVHHVEVEGRRNRVNIALVVRESEGFSNHEGVENGCQNGTATLAGRRRSSDSSSPVRLTTVGEGTSRVIEPCHAAQP